MKLYDSRRAPNPRRVRWVMAEKAIGDIEVVDVDLFAGEHKTADYLARTGLPNVPALEVREGCTITESIAICRYLEACYPEPNLFGRDPLEVALIEMWMRRAEMLVATPLMLAVRHSHPALGALETQIPALAEANLATARRGLKAMERQLAGRDWLAAERITIADIVLFCSVDFARMIRFQPGEDMTGVRRWAEAMRARPAAGAGFER